LNDRPLTLAYLADRPEALSLIAHWYYDEWARHVPGETPAIVRARLERKYLNRDRVPLILLAERGGEVVGAAQLKFREMSIYPEREHWLGGVYVATAQRGTGVGADLVEGVVRVARELGVETLHLQTLRLDGGLYTALGWALREQVRYEGREVRVMARRLEP
jgi:GNAT superfamily N-acetyltransferase